MQKIHGYIQYDDLHSFICLQVLQSCGSPELVRAVISPHLSKDAVDFLRGHLTPKEMTIFELLGEGWTKPRYNATMCVVALCALTCSSRATTSTSLCSAGQSGPGISTPHLITQSFVMAGNRQQSCS